MAKRIGLDLPDELHAWLVEQAKCDRRSLQAEILWLIEQATGRRGKES